MMAKLTEKDRKNKKGWDFSALSDSEGPGSSHELDSFPIETETNPEIKQDNSSVDPLAVLLKKEPKKEPKKEKVNTKVIPQEITESKKETQKIILEKPTAVKQENSDISISNFLKKEDSKSSVKIKEKIILEPEIIKEAPREILFQSFDEEVSVAKIIKSKPASKEEEEIEESTEKQEIDSAQIAKQRLNYDLKRPFVNSDFISTSTQLVPTKNLVHDFKKKELFCPWYLASSDEKSKTYFLTIFLMVAVMGVGSTFIF